MSEPPAHLSPDAEPPPAPLGATVASAPPRRRRTFQPRATATVALAWVLLWDRVTWGNIVSGLLVGLAVTLAFPLPSIDFHGRVRPHRVAWLVLLFLGDLVVASVQVSLLAFSRRRPRNSVIEVKLRSRSDFYLTLTSEVVGLVPGSVVIEARRSSSIIYLHLLDVSGQDEISRARSHVLEIEERIVRALGSDEEILALERMKEGTS